VFVRVRHGDVDDEPQRSAGTVDGVRVLSRSCLPTSATSQRCQRTS